MNRIISNGGLAFFVSLAGAQIAGLGLEGFVVAFWTAFVMGGVAAFTEACKENEGKKGKVAKAINGVLIL